MGNKALRTIKPGGHKPAWQAPKPYGGPADKQGRKGKLK